MEDGESVFSCSRKQALLFGIFFALYLIVNATISLRVGLHWDEMLDIDGCNTGEYVAAGRWGLALYRLLFGTGAFPLLAPLVAGVYISLSLVWQIEWLRLRGWFLPLFYGGIYLASVQWAYQLEFSHQCDAVALGMLLCTAGVACLERRRWCIGGLLLVPAIAVYQSLFLYAAALLLLFRLSADELSFKSFVRPVACLLGACCVYALLNALALQLPCLDPADIRFQQTYQLGMSRWSDFPCDAGLGEQVHFLGYYGIRFAKMTVKNMLGMAYAGQWVFASVVIPLAGLLLACCKKRRWVRVPFLLALWVLPFSLILPTLSDQGARISLAEPLVLAGFWGLFLRDADVGRKPKQVLALFLCFALLKSAYNVGDMAVREAYIHHSNLSCVREMHTRACALAESCEMAGAPVLLVGDEPFDPEPMWWRRESIVGERGYIPPRMLFRYCRFMCIPNMRYATSDEAAAYRAAHDRMPAWPAAGSVRREGGVILIRVD